MEAILPWFVIGSTDQAEYFLGVEVRVIEGLLDIMRLGFRILSFGFWVSDFEFRILSFGLWVSDFGFQILDFWIECVVGFTVV